MLDLVSQAEAQEHLRAEDADQSWLAIFIPAISQAVALWLKDEWRLYELLRDGSGEVVRDSNDDPVPLEDSNGDPIVKAIVKAAVLVELASQYRYREGEGKDNVVTPDAGHGYVLNKASTALLAPLRKSTVA